MKRPVVWYIDTVICIMSSPIYLLCYNFIDVLITFSKVCYLISSKIIPQWQRRIRLVFSTAL